MRAELDRVRVALTQEGDPFCRAAELMAESIAAPALQSAGIPKFSGRQ
jgi:hypothetical protein